MTDNDWRVEVYRGLDVYVLVTQRGDAASPDWGFEVRIGQEGADPAEAGDVELLSSGEQRYATRHAAEVAAFAAGYARVDALLGSEA